MIYKFYRPSSVLSHGEGSNPTTPVTMESLGASPALKDRFVSSSEDPVRFELENGAIDAQESVGGGVLLVVTGHMYLGDVRKPFCHTFFLHASETSKKRQYYVHNDVLRFLQDPAPLKESDVVEEEEETAVAAPAVVAAKEEEPAPAAADVVVEEAKEEAKEEPVAVAAPEPEVDAASAPEGYQEGVEESKEDFADEEEVAVAPVKETAKAAPKPPPGSWASLVASSAPAAATPPAKAAAAPAAKKQSASATTKTTDSSSSKATGSTKGEDTTTASNKPPAPNNSKKEKKDSDNKSDKPQRGRRDPDCTLVIKHVPDGTKEEHVRLIFEPFAVQTQTKIVGITVSQRGLAFVDYDSAAPVLMALEKKEKFSLNGKTVDIDQKTNDNKNRGRGGGNSSSNNRSNGQQRSGGGRSNSDNQRQRSSNGRGGGGGGRNNVKGGGGTSGGGGGGR